MFNFQDRVVFITGAGGAIGYAMAEAFAGFGAQVIIAEFNEATGAEAAQRLTEVGAGALFLRTDVSDPASVRAALDQVGQRYGRLDVLVNNAGINVSVQGRKPIHTFSDADWSRIVSVDLDGVYHCIKAAVPLMPQGASIINIGSIVGLVPLRNQCAFAAAKAGVFNLTKAAALELAPLGIRVNAIAPGSILMEGTREAFYADPEKAQGLISHIPMGRPGEPRDIAGPTLFLASEWASYMTGSVLVADGGWTCGFARDF